MKRLTLSCVVLIAVAWLAANGHPQGIVPTDADESSASAPVVRLGEHIIFTVQTGTGSLTPQQRADLINARLQRLVEDRRADPAGFEVGVDSVSGLPYVRHERYRGILFSVTAQDAGERIPLSVATEYAEKLENALRDVRSAQLHAEQRRRASELRREYLRGSMYALVYTLVLPLVWYILHLSLGYLRNRLARSARLRHSIHWRNIEVVSASRVEALLLSVLTLIQVAVYLFLLAMYVNLMLSAFPATRGQSNVIQRTVADALSQAGNALVDTIPNVVNIILIVLGAKIALRGFNWVMSHVESEHLNLEPYVPQEFVKPTRSLGKFLIVLIALFFIAPNIPGMGTDIGKIITVFVGVIISFSSTNTVGNFLAGIVIAYMRPFHRGDRVKIGEVMGDVVDSSFLFTRLRTPKNEEVLIPSLQMLNGVIVNYSSAPDGVVLHTTVSIGYDTPRQQVERLLLQAAQHTEGCEQEPPPFVLVRSLDDFYVTYELNVYTRCASQMQNIYSRLHQNIKDAFDAAGVEIMSPHYLALRDGNPVNIPKGGVTNARDRPTPIE